MSRSRLLGIIHVSTPGIWSLCGKYGGSWNYKVSRSTCARCLVLWDFYLSIGVKTAVKKFRSGKLEVLSGRSLVARLKMNPEHAAQVAAIKAAP